MNTSSKKITLVLLILALLLVGGGLLLRFVLRAPAPAPPTPQPIAVAPTPPREVILYFGSADGTHLVAESRELNDCNDDQACQRAVLDALIAGPSGSGIPLVPPHTVLRSISQDDQGQATVDFSNEMVNGQPGGSMSELLSVYSVVDTLAVNFSYLRQVRFLIEDQPVETLKGHVDLRQPLTPDFSLTRSASEEDAVPEVPKPAAEGQ